MAHPSSPGGDAHQAEEERTERSSQPVRTVAGPSASGPSASGPSEAGPSMAELVAELRQRLALVRQGGDERARRRHLERGKLLVRDRVDRLLDPGAAFLELSPLAAWDLYGEPLPSAGLVTGIGQVEGRYCMVVANDATVKGGTYFPVTVKKHLRAQEIAAASGVAVLLPGRFRRGLSPSAGPGFPGPGPLRPDLLQPGPNV